MTYLVNANALYIVCIEIEGRDIGQFLPMKFTRNINAKYSEIFEIFLKIDYLL